MGQLMNFLHLNLHFSPNSVKVVYPFHILKHIRSGDGSRSLLYNLLVASLHRTVSSKQGNGIAILISQDLNLQMAGMSGQLHDENGWSWNFCLDLDNQRLTKSALLYYILCPTWCFKAWSYPLTCLKRFGKSSAELTLRMPFPPPPSEAFTITG